MSNDLTKEMQRQQYAYAGIVLLTGTTNYAAECFAVEFLTDTVISTLIGANIVQQGLNLNQITWEKGRVLFVRFNAITLVSGSVILYRREV
jgi:hypothetical protein